MGGVLLASMHTRLLLSGTSLVSTLVGVLTFYVLEYAYVWHMNIMHRTRTVACIQANRLTNNSNTSLYIVKKYIVRARSLPNSVTAVLLLASTNILASTHRARSTFTFYEAP